MTNTPHLGMPFIEGSQAQKHVTHNEALRILDAAIQIGVLDTDRTSPPSTPAEGDRHIVASGAAGAWAGQTDAVAVYEDGAWRFLTPKLGWCAWSNADGALLVYDGTAWTKAASGGTGTLSGSIAQLGINATASDPNLLAVRSNAALFNAVDVADGGTGDVRVQISKEGSANTASVVFSHAFSGRAEFGLVESDAFKLKVSDDGSTFVEALTFDQSTGNASFQRGLALTGVISPSQITSNRDDYAPTGFAAASTLRLSSDATRTITGFAGGVEGRTIIVHNVGAQNIVLAHQDGGSSAANRLLLGGHVTLAADASLTLRYDGTTQRWRTISPTSSSGGGGGAAAGMTDAERQNSLLDWVYLSKSLGDIRRGINLFATGFKAATDALRGINAGSSSNVDVSNAAASGYVAPSTTVGSNQIPLMTGATTSGVTMSADAEFSGSFPAWQAANRNATDFWSSTTTPFPHWLKFDFGSSKTIATYTVQCRGDSITTAAGAWTLQGSATGSFAGEQVTLDTQSGHTWANGQIKTFNIASPAGYRYYRLHVTAGTDPSGTLQIAEVTLLTAGITSNMTLVTASQTADASVSNGRALIEFDNTATPTLNTDLTVEVTCNGGSNWTSATLSLVTTHSQGGRAVAETADTACTSGTSFAARIKTQNSKSVPIYGASLVVH